MIMLNENRHTLPSAQRSPVPDMAGGAGSRAEGDAVALPPRPGKDEVAGKDQTSFERVGQRFRQHDQRECLLVIWCLV